MYTSESYAVESAIPIFTKLKTILACLITPWFLGNSSSSSSPSPYSKKKKSKSRIESEIEVDVSQARGCRGSVGGGIRSEQVHRWGHSWSWLSRWMLRRL